MGDYGKDPCYGGGGGGGIFGGGGWEWIIIVIVIVLIFFPGILSGFGGGACAPNYGTNKCCD